MMDLTQEQYEDLVLAGKAVCRTCQIESDGAGDLRNGKCPYCGKKTVCGPITLLEMQLEILRKKVK